MKQLDTKQFPERKMKKSKPVKCAKFELFFFKSGQTLQKKKRNLNVIQEKASHGCQMKNGMTTQRWNQLTQNERKERSEEKIFKTWDCKVLRRAQYVLQPIFCADTLPYL